jgi:hypothetical protein
VSARRRFIKATDRGRSSDLTGTGMIVPCAVRPDPIIEMSPS